MPATLPPEQQVKVWVGDSMFHWHAVTYARDSITGIPYKLATDCHSCRLALPVYAVDSIHIRDSQSPDQIGEMLGLSVAVVLVGTIALAVLHVH